MDMLSTEIDGIKRDFPKFRFKCPDPASVQSTKTFLTKPEHELNKIQEMLDFIEKNPEVKRLMEDRLKSWLALIANELRTRFSGRKSRCPIVK